MVHLPPCMVADLITRLVWIRLQHVTRCCILKNGQGYHPIKPWLGLAFYICFAKLLIALAAHFRFSTCLDADLRVWMVLCQYVLLFSSCATDGSKLSCKGGRRQSEQSGKWLGVSSDKTLVGPGLLHFFAKKPIALAAHVRFSTCLDAGL